MKVFRIVAPTFLLSLGVVCSVPAQEEEVEDTSVPIIDELVTDYTVGTAHAVHVSSYDFHPQIQVLPNEPKPRVVPRPKKVKLDGAGNLIEDVDTSADDSGKIPEEYAGFEGISATGWDPPDPSLAVGPNHVVAVVNASVAWWDKKTQTPQFSRTLQSFFSSVGAGGFCFDPKCLYDEHSGRYFVMTLEQYTNQSWITFAVSDDSDPNGNWYMYRTSARTTVAGQSFWVDYPGLGVDDVAFYVTGNLFGFSGGFAGVKFRVFPKSSILNGGSVTFNDLRDGNGYSAQCAHMNTTVGFPYFISVDNSDARLQAIQNPTTSPSLATRTINITNWSSPGNAPNQGGGGVDTLDGRIINAYYRDKRLLAAHAVVSGGRAVNRWYEFRTSDWPASGNPGVRQQGTVNMGSGIWQFFPAIAKNTDRQIAMVMARSASNERLSIWSAWQNSSDPSDTLPNTFEVKAGNFSYPGGRYGDYFDVAVDPQNDRTFWGIGEIPESGNNWSTWIGTLGTNPAVTNYIGSGSPGTGGVTPFLRVLPCRMGGKFRVRIEDTPAGTPFFLLVGFSTTNISFNGADLYVSPPWSIVFPATTDGAGEWSIDAPLATSASFVGPLIYVQGLFFDNGAPQGASSSRAAEVFIGDD